MRIHLIGLLALLPLAAACDDDDRNSALFRIEIQNVSDDDAVETNRAGGTMPLSAGLWAVFHGGDPIFEVGEQASAGLELLAEEGIPSEEFAPVPVSADLLSEVAADRDVTALDVFESPGGPDGGPHLFAGERVVIEFRAERGQDFQFVTMLMQSNDLFLAFDGGGFDLFDIFGQPREGDITDAVTVFDAGTEVDEPLGQGDGQPLAPGAVFGAGTPDDDPITEGEFVLDLEDVDDMIRVILTRL